MGQPMSFMGLGGGLRSSQMLNFLMGRVYQQFANKDIRNFDDFQFAILDIFNTFNSSLPGKHYNVPPCEEIEAMFISWKNAKVQDRRDIFIQFMKDNVRLSKVDNATVITGVVAPPVAMAVKRAWESVPLLKMIKAIPDIFFVLSATVLALVSVKISRRIFTAIKASSTHSEPDIQTKTDHEESFMGFGGGLQSSQMLNFLMGKVYQQFIDKDIQNFEDFQFAILDTFNTFNSSLPGKHYNVPPRKEIEAMFVSWKTARVQHRKDIFIQFMKANVRLSKVDNATVITGVVTPPVAMAVKRAGESVPLLKMIKAIPDIFFVLSATVLALVYVKISISIFTAIKASSTHSEPDIHTKTKTMGEARAPHGGAAASSVIGNHDEEQEIRPFKPVAKQRIVGGEAKRLEEGIVEGGAKRPRTVEEGIVEAGAKKLGTVEGEAKKLGTFEEGIVEAGAKKLGTVEEGIVEGGAKQEGTVEGGVKKLRTVEGGAKKLGTVEEEIVGGGAKEEGNVEGGAKKLGTVEEGIVEAGAKKLRTVEEGTVEAGAKKAKKKKDEGTAKYKTIKILK